MCWKENALYKGAVMVKAWQVGFILYAIPLLCCPAYAQNLVQNPGFEDSTDATDSPGWTLTAGHGTIFDNGQGQAEGPAIRPDEPPPSGNPNAHSGLWDVQFAATNAEDASAGTLSQAITTTAGSTYLVTFFLMNSDGPHNTFLATFGGQTVLSLTDSSAFGYTQYSYQVKATSSSSVLAFSAEQDPGYFYLDDISVEPAPAPVMGGGLVSLAVLLAGFSVRRARRPTAA
jgi:hypothetical protein